MAPGLVLIRLEYYQGRGERALSLKLKAMDLTGQPVSDPAFYRD